MDVLLNSINKRDPDTVREILINDPALIKGEHFFAAAKTGDISLLKYLVEYSRISLSEVDENNRNVLHYCALSNNAEAFEYLVKKCGMDPLSGDAQRITPWELAVKNGCNFICEWMSERYGDIGDYYKNPVRSGFFPDPSIVRVGEDYYMVNSSFIFFPCIPVSHSRDLINWRIIGYAVNNPEWAHIDELEGGRGYWAPDISYYEGKFYITATYRLNDVPPVIRRQIVVSSERPEGPYSEPVFIDEDGIDPSIFNDDDGRRYMLLNRGARIFELDKTATEKISDAKLLYYGDMKRAPEGPHLYKRNGYYYLLLAEGGTGMGHRVTVMRSRELFGDYEPSPYNPIMIQRDENAAIQRCGHGDLVETQDGRWFMVYLCGRQIDKKYSILGRETAVDPVTWTPDGWPVVNNLKGPSVLQKKPFPQFEAEKDDRTESKAVSGTGLPFGFMTPRTFKKDDIRCTEAEYNEITGDILYADFEIRGSRAPLSSVESRNIVLRRQTSYKFISSVRVSSDMAMEDGQECGLTAYYDENTYCLFGIMKMDGRLYLYSREHIGDEDRLFTDDVAIDERIADGSGRDITLVMKTDGLKRELLYSFDNSAAISFNTLNNVYYLCDEGLKKGKRFTGAMVGMYAYEGERAAKPFICRMERFYYEDEAQG